MASRLYYDSTAVPTLTPTFASEWDTTTDAVRRALNTSAASSAMTTQSVNEPLNVVTSNLDYLMGQFISPPLATQTIAGTVKGQMRCAENSTGMNARAQLIIRVINRGGDVVRGTLYAGDLTTETASPTSEFFSSLRNVKMPRGGSTALTSTDVVYGDRLLVEVGMRLHNDVANARIATFRIGDADAADLAEDETDTDDNNPWIEFSQTLVFVSDRCTEHLGWPYA